MKLPSGDQAVIDDDKLIGYCLNPEHPEGRHKARVFQSVLGRGSSPGRREGIGGVCRGNPAWRLVHDGFYAAP